MHRIIGPLIGLVVVACHGGRSPESALVRADDLAQPKIQCDDYQGSALDALQHFSGSMHQHSSYSDGDIFAVPADYYAQIEERGMDYAAGSEHSDTLDIGVFISVGSDCFSTPDGLLTCLTPNGPDDLIKWRATGNQTVAATSADFLAIRGFEWTSDRFGHINVYFSSNFSNAKTDLGYLVTDQAFWDWFARAPDMPGLLGGSHSSPVPFGGGADGLAHFNHPGDKCLDAADPGCDWHDFALVPEAAGRMYGIELFNGSGGDDKYLPRWLRALEQGWWLSPVGVEDEHGTDWGSLSLAKTITLATELTEAGFREAWLARRTYALRGDYADLRLNLQAAGHPMGSQMRCDLGSDVPYVAEVFPGTNPVAGMQLLNRRGEIVAATDTTRLEWNLPVTAQAEHYILQVLTPDARGAAYAAPVQIAPRQE